MISRETGLPISENEHIIQSLFDIATTEVGTRVMRRNYGSILIPSIDAPLNAITRMQIASSLTLAFAQFEPRAEVRAIQLTADREGRTEILIDAINKRTAERFKGQIDREGARLQ